MAEGARTHQAEETRRLLEDQITSQAQQLMETQSMIADLLEQFFQVLLCLMPITSPPPTSPQPVIPTTMLPSVCDG